MTLRRDGTPQRFNPAGMMQTDACPDCGQVMRKCNLARHQQRRHDPTYVPPSRTKSYRQEHRAKWTDAAPWSLNADRKAYFGNETGTLYLIHFSRPVSGHAGHYMGWTNNLSGRLAAHAKGMGSKLTREACRQGLTFALTWAEPGTREDEQRIKKNRRLPELCSVCRHGALEKRATRSRAWRAGRRTS